MQCLHCMMQFILILLSAGTITDGDDRYGPRDKRYLFAWQGSLNVCDLERTWEQDFIFKFGREPTTL